MGGGGDSSFAFGERLSRLAMITDLANLCDETFRRNKTRELDVVEMHEGMVSSVSLGFFLPRGRERSDARRRSATRHTIVRESASPRVRDAYENADAASFNATYCITIRQ